MLDLVKHVIKPIATGAAILIGIGAVSAYSDLKNWLESFTVHSEPSSDFDPWNYFTGSESNEDGVIVLHADELRQLRWMSTSQLKAIFRGKRQKFRVESSPAAYQELRWMSTSQIEAIFGTKDIP